MYFNRTPVKVLPDGSLSTVFPFHVCTEGLEDRVIFRSDEDLKTAHNYIPICARRANVIVFVDCVVHTHMHSGVLARSYEDAQSFIDKYKITCSKYLTNKYGKGESLSLFNGVAAKPIPLEDNHHVRNTICYIIKNSLDVGQMIDRYEWNSFRSLFCDGKIATGTTAISALSYREKRNLLNVSSVRGDAPWLISGGGVIEPASYCDWHYAQEAFLNDQKYFYRVMGLTDCDQMKEEMVVAPLSWKTVDQLIPIIEDRCMKRYSKHLSDLTYGEKIPIIKAVWYSQKVSVAQLARCFSLRKEMVCRILPSGSRAVNREDTLAGE